MPVPCPTHYQVSASSVHVAGLKEEAEVPQEDGKLVLEIVASVFPDVPEDEVKAAIASKTERTYQ